MPDAALNVFRFRSHFNLKQPILQMRKLRHRRLSQLIQSWEERWSGLELRQWAPALPFCAQGLWGCSTLGTLGSTVNVGHVCQLGSGAMPLPSDPQRVVLRSKQKWM